jgi:hypothetical protein
MRVRQLKCQAAARKVELNDGFVEALKNWSDKVVSNTDWRWRSDALS